MTLVPKLELDFMVAYLHTINEVNKSNGSQDTWLRNPERFMLFDVCDLDLMTWACELDLDNIEIYLPYKN